MMVKGGVYDNDGGSVGIVSDTEVDDDAYDNAIEHDSFDSRCDSHCDSDDSGSNGFNVFGRQGWQYWWS